MDAYDFCDKPACAIDAVVERQTVAKVPPPLTRLTIFLTCHGACLKKPPAATERDEPTTH